jgi:tetrahydroxynaphthalene reductase
MGSIATPAAPFRLDGKVALVTGAGRGISGEMALQLARCGARVVINSKRSTQSAEKVVQEIKGGVGCWSQM